MLWVLITVEVPQGGSSNEYPQHMFLWRNKKNISTFGLKKSVLPRAIQYAATHPRTSVSDQSLVKITTEH